MLTVRCGTVRYGRPQVFSGYVCDRYFRSAVPLVDVFEALARLGQLDALFAEMAEKLREEVIAPLLSARYVPPPKVGKAGVDCFGGEVSTSRLLYRYVCARSA